MLCFVFNSYTVTSRDSTASENCFDSVRFVKLTEEIIHNTNECTFDAQNFVLMLQLHVSASLTPSSGSWTPKFKTYSI